MAIKNNEVLTITRIFDAPRSLIWKAWTDPEHMTQWWGPKYFTSPLNKVDLRVGGKVLSCMRGPDGKDYWSTGVYKEIIPEQKLVVTDSFADEKGNVVPASHYGMAGEWPLELLVTITLEDIGGKTKMILEHEGLPAGMVREMTETGWNESFDKLVENIIPGDRTKITVERGKQEIISKRVFDAPRDLVFKAYTDRNLIARWWGPRRFETIVDKLEAKQGGLWRYINRDTTGNEYAFHGVFHEVKAPERIVDTFEFEGMPGHVALETCILEDIGGRTKMIGRTVFQSVEDRDGMLESDMEEGMIETFDRLAELVEKLKIEKKAA